MALNIPVLPLVGSIVGGGGDGDLDFDGVSNVVLHDGTTLTPVGAVYTLGQHVLAQTILVRAGVTIRTVGYMISCWALYGDVTSSILYDGDAAVANTAGAAVVNPSNFGAPNSSGAAGRTTAGNGNAAASTNKPTGGNGGAGGTAGAFLAGAAGAGTWGTSTGPFVQPAILATAYLGGAGGSINGGRGGGGGASNGGTSGGGGASGGCITIRTKTLAFPGLIAARGGAGGDASGDAGGGGGGGGGSVYIAYYELIGGLPTLDVSGGVGGAGAGSGTPGTAGTVGQTFTLFYG